MKRFLGGVPLLSFLIIAYFVYHGIYGNRGLLRLEQIHQEYVQAIQEAQKVSTEKELLQKKVDAFKNGAPDLIQEEALRVLNMGNSEDMVILEND